MTYLNLGETTSDEAPDKVETPDETPDTEEPVKLEPKEVKEEPPEEEKSVKTEKSKTDETPVPEKNESHDSFMHRYTNHSFVLRRIARPYRTAAAEKVWKEFNI